VGVSDAERPSVLVRVTVRLPLARGVTDTEPDSLAVTLGDAVDVGEWLSVCDADAPSLRVALGLAVSVGSGVADAGGGSHAQSTCTGVPGVASSYGVTTIEKRLKTLSGDVASDSSASSTRERSPHSKLELSHASSEPASTPSAAESPGMGQPVPTNSIVSSPTLASLHVDTTSVPPLNQSLLLSSSSSSAPTPSSTVNTSALTCVSNAASSSGEYKES